MGAFLPVKTVSALVNRWYLYKIKIAQTGVFVHNFRRKMWKTSEKEQPRRPGQAPGGGNFSQKASQSSPPQTIKFKSFFSLVDGVLGKGVVYQLLKGHPIAMAQLTGLLHHRLQPLQGLALHHRGGIPGIDLPVPGGDSLQLRQVGIR